MITSLVLVVTITTKNVCSASCIVLLHTFVRSGFMVVVKTKLWFLVHVVMSHDSSVIICLAQTWGYRQDSTAWSMSRLYLTNKQNVFFRFSRSIQINQMTSFLPITGKNIHIRNSCHYQIPQYPANIPQRLIKSWWRR
jgi:hypothetical protein